MKIPKLSLFNFFTLSYLPEPKTRLLSPLKSNSLTWVKLAIEYSLQYFKNVCVYYIRKLIYPSIPLSLTQTNVKDATEDKATIKSSVVKIQFMQQNIY